MKTKPRTKGNNTILMILIVIIITLALLLGVRQGFELGIKKCNKHYSGFIKNNCYCFVPASPYETERFIPLTLLNLSTS